MRMEETGLPTSGLKAPGVGGRGAAHSSKSLAQKGVWAGRGRHPGTAKCVSWTRIQGNCASPHSVCSEANAFLSYCLCRRLVVGTPFISSLGERPRCLESGCGWLDSKGRKAAWWEHLRVPGGKEARAGPCRPRCAHSAARLVAWDATLWGGKEGADGGTLGLSSCAGGERVLEITVSSSPPPQLPQPPQLTKSLVPTLVEQTQTA